MGSRVELFAQIRRDARVEGASIRELVRSSPRLDPFKPTIDAMLVEDTTAPRKQRHTPEDSCPAHRGAWSERIVVFDGA
jgi:hypothetical protein